MLPMKTEVKKSIIHLLFLLTVLLSAIGGFSQDIDFGKSYVNLTKGLNGGTLETGDILEIRASIVVRNGRISEPGKLTF